MKCPVCNEELEFDDERDRDDDVYSDEIVVRQWWYCPNCEYDYMVTRHYSQDGVQFERV